MASLNYCTVVPILTHIFLLLMICSPTTILSQDPSSSSPTIAQCTSSLLPLISCAPFVQGTSLSPGQQCCGNLKQLYSQEPHCLCLLLNDTAMSSFPINRTLALQLPALCALQVDISTCPGEQLQVPPISPASQISFRARNNSTVPKNNFTVAASPSILVAPRPSMMGFGFGSSDAVILKTKNGGAVLMTLVAILFGYNNLI